jgi:sulfonate transport system substrate-binding protein
LTLASALLLLATADSRAEEKVRIGYQKYGTMLLLKEAGALDATLKAQGVTVEWHEFPSGPPLLEALNVGAIDFGTTGEAPPIFAQAAGAPLVYVSVEPPAPHGEAILVPKDSPIHSVAELKGRKVALTKGANVHYLVVRALEDAGLSYSDIQPVYLAPADARAAFEQGAVDAWAIWDPYFAAAAASTSARILADGLKADGQLLAANHEFQLAERKFYTAHPALVRTIVAALKDTEIRLHDNPAEAARLLSPRTGIPVPILETAFSRMGYGVEPISPEIAAQQQKIADTFQQLGLIPKHISIADALPGSGS